MDSDKNKLGGYVAHASFWDYGLEKFVSVPIRIGGTMMHPRTRELAYKDNFIEGNLARRKVQLGKSGSLESTDYKLLDRAEQEIDRLRDVVSDLVNEVNKTKKKKAAQKMSHSPDLCAIYQKAKKFAETRKMRVYFCVTETGTSHVMVTPPGKHLSKLDDWNPNHHMEMTPIGIGLADQKQAFETINGLIDKVEKELIGPECYCNRFSCSGNLFDKLVRKGGTGKYLWYDSRLLEKGSGQPWMRDSDETCYFCSAKRDPRKRTKESARKINKLIAEAIAKEEPLGSIKGTKIVERTMIGDGVKKLVWKKHSIEMHCETCGCLTPHDPFLVEDIAVCLTCLTPRKISTAKEEEK